MKNVFIKLPQWKAYLYSLLERIKLYKAINSNRHKWNLNRKEILLLRQMQSKYLAKGVMRKPKAFRYQTLIQNVLIDNVTTATKEEIELAQKFILINLLQLEDLIMEMKDLKKFAKEVGIKDTDVKKMDEETLVREIITRVEPQQEYSKELVAFYNDLPDKFFDDAEATGGATQSNSDEGGYSIDDIVEVINDFTKVTELKEVLEDEDVAPMFEGFDPSPYKLAPKLKKAMIEFLQNPPAEEESAAEDNPNAEVIAAIEELESEEDLVAAYEELQEQYFSELNLDSVESADDLKQAMIACLTPEPEPESEPEPEKKVSVLDRLKKGKDKAKVETKKETKSSDEWDWFDPNGDPEEMYAQVEAIKGIAKLKGFAKQKMGLSFKVGTKKDEILDTIATQLQSGAECAVEESTEEKEAELTIEMVNEAAKAKDKETLAAMCEQMGIKLNALQKKSVPGMKSKLEEAIGEPEKKEPAKKKIQLKGKAKAESKPSESQSVYQVMEEMVLDGKSEDAIVKAVSSFYKDKGKSILFIKKRVKTMIPIIKLDNDME